jgi:hypothetical protein
MPEPRPLTLPATTGVIFGHLRPLARRDPANGWLLLRLLSGFGRGDEDAYRLLQDPGAPAYLDPAVAPPAWLPWLAALVGARISDGMPVVQQRAEVENPAGWTRGSPDAIAAAARPFMREPFRIVIRQRYDPNLGAGTDAPDDLQVRLRASDVVDEQRAIRAVLAAVPWDIRAHVLVTNETDWDSVVAQNSTWDSTVTTHGSWDDLVSDED